MNNQERESVAPDTADSAPKHNIWVPIKGVAAFSAATGLALSPLAMEDANSVARESTHYLQVEASELEDLTSQIEADNERRLLIKAMSRAATHHAEDAGLDEHQAEFDVIDLAAFEVVQSFEMPDYPFEVNIYSDSESMQVNPEDLQRVVMWPYENSDRFEKGSLERRSLDWDYDFIANGGLRNSPLNLFVYSENDQACIVGNDLVVPVDGDFEAVCDTTGLYRADMDDILNGLPARQVIVTTGGMDWDYNVAFNVVMAHEFGHGVDEAKRRYIDIESKDIEMEVCGLERKELIGRVVNAEVTVTPSSDVNCSVLEGTLSPGDFSEGYASWLHEQVRIDGLDVAEDSIFYTDPSTSVLAQE